MIDFLSKIDTDLLLTLNGIHAPLLFTGKMIWVPMYASILYVLLRNFNWKVALCMVVGIALTITFADQMCNSFLRPLIGRLRPSNPENPIADMVYIVNGRHGGGNGFPRHISCISFPHSPLTHIYSPLGLYQFIYKIVFGVTLPG